MCLFGSTCVYFAFKSPVPSSAAIKVGAERLDYYLPKLQGKRLGLIVNASSCVQKTPLLDTLLALKLRVGAIFVPEHGYKTSADAGQKVSDTTIYGIPIYSLYGAARKPSLSSLFGIDLLVFDLQDVGARFYTYASTMTYAMEAAAVAKIPFLILDRPNPNGYYVDGPVLVPSERSFVGLHPIPIVHGLTLGELAGMINGQGWLASGLFCQLEVVKVAGWTHDMRYVLPVSPSPNLPTAQAVGLYPSFGLFEGTKISVGRGTELPFEGIGYPDSTFGSFSFVPKSRPTGIAPKYAGERCYGQDFRDQKLFSRLFLAPLLKFYSLFPNKKHFFLPYFDKLAGTPVLRKQIMAGYDEIRIRKSWEPALALYKDARKRYLLYPDFK